MLDYIKVKSLTFWAGILAIAVGCADIMDVGNQEQLGQFSELVSVLIGGYDASPATLITLGLGLIGIRRKLDDA